MIRRTPEGALKSKNPSKAAATEQKLKDLLPPALAESGAIGFAVCDRRLRFRLVNEAWARMDGVTCDDHLGATIRSVLGPAAKKLELAFERVFSSGSPLLGYEFSAELPARSDEGHWITSCFPIMDASESLQLAGAMILEITQLKRLEMWSHKLLADSVRILEDVFASRKLTGGAFSGQPATALEQPDMEELSPREREVIQLLALSKGNKEVAAELGISVRTIETYRARIMLKLRVHSLSELVHYAIRNGIVKP
jgi:DNA-binding CsgD family transcriptional regulator